MYLNGGKWFNAIKWVKLTGNRQTYRKLMFMEKILAPGGCLPLSRGYIHVYFHNIETSSSLKPLGQSKPNFMWSIVRKREKSLYKWSRSHDQEGRHDYK